MYPPPCIIIDFVSHFPYTVDSITGYDKVKELKKIKKELERQGWRIERRAKHGMAFPPDKSKPPVVLPSTPGGGRWLQNLIAQLRRSGFQWPPEK